MAEIRACAKNMFQITYVFKMCAHLTNNFKKLSINNTQLQFHVILYLTVITYIKN